MMSKQSSILTRRQFFQTAGTTAVIVILPQWAPGQQANSQALIDQAFRAQVNGDFSTAESLFRQLVRAGRTDEFILRGLAWNLSRVGKHSEAIRISLDNHHLHPCAWSVAQICDAYVSAGEYDDGRRWLRYAMRYKNEWGSTRSVFESLIELVSTRLCILKYVIDPTMLENNPWLKATNGEIVCPNISNDLKHQSSTFHMSYASTITEDTVGGNKIIRIRPNGSKPFEIQFRAKLNSINMKQQARSFRTEELPDSVKSYVKSTPCVEVDSETVQQIVEPLINKDKVQTIENIFAWTNKNLKYLGVEGGDALELGGGCVASLKRRGGHCEGQTSAVVGLLRAAGIPARFIRGHGGIGGKSGVPTMHSWTEFFVPSIGWVPWDIGNPPFCTPPGLCLAQFRYISPFAAKGGGDPATADLWNFQSLLFPSGLIRPGHASFTLESEPLS